MNQQSGAYSQYPPPPPLQVTYSYPTNPYPAAPASPYGYAAPPQTQPQNALQQPQQHQTVQSQQPYFGRLPPASFRPSQQQPAPQSQPRPTPAAGLRQPRRFQRKPAQASSSRQTATPQANADDGPPAGPGAPGPQADSPDLEDQLRDALQRDNQTDNEHDGDDNDDDNDDDKGDENDPVFNLPPPPEGNYPGEQELEKSIHAWSLEHGYEVVRRASKKNAGGVIYKRYYHCSKHGKLANTGKLTDNSRVRTRRKSNRMGCPMSLAAVSVDPQNPGGEWQIRHRKTHHNHGPLDALALAGHRRRARMGGVEKAVDGLFAIGTPTTQVLQFLQKTNPEGLFTRTDVANMKLKWKKYGTCVHLSGQYAKNSQATPGADGERSGVPSACLRCREKKTKCDSVRPICGTCVQNSWNCEYDHEPGPGQLNQQPSGTPNNATAGSSQQATPQTIVGRRQQTALGAQRAQAEQILADLQNFQQEHVKPKRLELNSSSVEILAHSSCGNCDSYKNVPTMYTASDWQAFSDAFLEASLKENTHSTLMGEKKEPVRPVATADGQEVEVEDWNEYIKQLAIFHRRNSALVGALWGALAPSFRTRIQGFRSAAEAWRALEEMCCPRGSDQAWKLYSELHSITLAGCNGNLQDYIGRLETAYAAFGRLRMSVQYPHDRLGRHRNDPSSSTSSSLTAAQQAAHNKHPHQHQQALSPGSGGDVVGEEALCFLFLKGLSPEYKRFIDTLCATSNVGGFGTGFKLGFREVAKRAVEFEGMRRGGQGQGQGQ
ncbi:hypothetical protein LTR85_004089 [Meristemomyces frigidus]|nr:hypothetical protein LTR85_004089 [Meristemomyces frigidus]